ncbi:Protein of unknown function [Amphibacillus marinus]|uniref:DUF2929 domain-containing protein n=1 Tax=Amphibacillus marinus TaxID=872970 RepID=A0A1H8Q8W2_9BACI|nr:DUF2929 family protein [Amphibacillus marinus]SEO50506.1 Protein of unknown function [Amphibacillus marinus]
MRFIIIIIWSFALSLVLSYVLTSMAGYSFSFLPVIGLTLLFSFVGIFVGEKLIDD